MVEDSERPERQRARGILGRPRACGILTESGFIMRRRAILLLAVVSSLSAEQGVLVVQVKDIHKQAVLGLQLRAEGGGVSAPTDVAGIARIPLSPQTESGARVTLQL